MDDLQRLLRCYRILSVYLLACSSCHPIKSHRCLLVSFQVLGRILSALRWATKITLRLSCDERSALDRASAGTEYQCQVRFRLLGERTGGRNYPCALTALPGSRRLSGFPGERSLAEPRFETRSPTPHESEDLLQLYAATRREKAEICTRECDIAENHDTGANRKSVLRTEEG